MLRIICFSCRRRYLPPQHWSARRTHLWLLSQAKSAKEAKLISMNVMS